jgi:hypothetical protein
MLNKGNKKCYYFNNKDAEIYLQMQLWKILPISS